MKSQKGITLMSLIVYVVAFLMVIGIVGAITTFFYTNYSFLDKKSTVAAEYSKLNLLFSEENKANGNYVFDLQSNVDTNILSKSEIDENYWNINDEYETKYDLLDSLNSICKRFFNTYVLFNDKNIIGWRSDEKVIYYNQSIICNNVEKFTINKTQENGKEMLTVYVEFDNKSFSTKYTF